MSVFISQLYTHNKFSLCHCYKIKFNNFGALFDFGLKIFKNTRLTEIER